MRADAPALGVEVGALGADTDLTVTAAAELVLTLFLTAAGTDFLDTTGPASAELREEDLLLKVVVVLPADTPAAHFLMAPPAGAAASTLPALVFLSNEVSLSNRCTMEATLVCLLSLSSRGFPVLSAATADTVAVCTCPDVCSCSCANELIRLLRRR